VYLLLQD